MENRQNCRYKMVAGLMLLFAVSAVGVTGSAVAHGVGISENAIGTIVNSVPVFGALIGSGATCEAPCLVVKRVGRKYQVVDVAYYSEDGHKYGIVVLESNGGYVE